MPRAVVTPRPLSPARAAALFGTATLGPGLLVAAGALAGGGWAVAALVAITAVAALLDRLAAEASPGVPGAEFPAAPALSAALAALHLSLVPLVVWGLAGGSDLAAGERAVLFAAAAL
jgi:alkane 1-monooxygenase